MPIKDGITYIDNTYLRDVATCSTRAFILRVLQKASIDSNKVAAHVGNCFHAGIETLCKTGSEEEAIEAFLTTYDKLIPTQAEGWDEIKTLRLRKEG